MPEQFAKVRDRWVRALARLSLVAVLALMGALFVGSAAEGRAVSGAETASVRVGQQVEPDRGGVVAEAKPSGLVLGGVMIGGGLVVLMIGAFKPERREGAATRV